MYVTGQPHGNSACFMNCFISMSGNTRSIIPRTPRRTGSVWERQEQGNAWLAALAAGLAENWEQSWLWNRQMRQTGKQVLGKWREGSLHQTIQEEIHWREKALAVKIQHGVAGIEEQEKEEKLLGFLQEWGQEAQRARCMDERTARDILEQKLDSGQEETYIGQMEQCINGGYHLLEEAAVGAAKLYFTETLTSHPSCSRFLVEYPQEMFSRQSGELLLSRQEEELRKKLEETRVL